MNLLEELIPVKKHTKQHNVKKNDKQRLEKKIENTVIYTELSTVPKSTSQVYSSVGATASSMKLLIFKKLKDTKLGVLGRGLRSQKALGRLVNMIKTCHMKPLKINEK